MAGDVVKPADSMIVGPLWLFSSIRNKTVWNTMTVGKAFCKSMDGAFGRIMYRKHKSIARIRIYNSTKDRALSFLWKKWSSAVNLPGHWSLAGEWCHIWGSAFVSAAVARPALVRGSPCC